MVKISNVRSVLKRLSRSERGIESVEVEALLSLVAEVSCEDRWLEGGVSRDSVWEREKSLLSRKTSACRRANITL
jgi:hypothetical protein